MTTKQAVEIIGDYGDILMETNQLGVIVQSESLLPHSKADIKLAIKTYWAFLKSSDKLTDDFRNQLEVGFIFLSHFTNDEKVKAAQQNEGLLAELYEAMSQEGQSLLNEIRNLDKAFDMVTTQSND